MTAAGFAIAPPSPRSLQVVGGMTQRPRVVDGRVEVRYRSEPRHARVVTLIWSADLGVEVRNAMGVELPDAEAWSDLIRRLLKSLKAPDAQPCPPTLRPTRRRRS
jgi:hypothetical protein